MPKARLEILREWAQLLPLEQFLVRHTNLFLLIGSSSVDPKLDLRARAGRSSTEVAIVANAPENPQQQRIAVGRASSCDIVLRDASVSKLHAQLQVSDGARLELLDLGSRNGTRVNDRAIKPYEPVPVSSGDRIVFGDVVTYLADARLVYSLVSKPAAAEDAPAPTSTWRLVTALSPESCRWQRGDGCWVSITIALESDFESVMVCDSTGREQQVGSYEEALALAKQWRT